VQYWKQMIFCVHISISLALPLSKLRVCLMHFFNFQKFKIKGLKSIEVIALS